MSENARTHFVDPALALQGLPIQAGQKVADFGCGSGYFSLEFARRVGAEGEVWALDILPQALEAVASQAKSLGINNIRTERVNLEKAGGAKLLAESVDWVVLKDMLFQNKDKALVLAEAARVLRPDGRIFIMEWKPEALSMGPDRELRISPDALQDLVTTAGFYVEREIPVGAFHYAFMARK